MARGWRMAAIAALGVATSCAPRPMMCGTSVADRAAGSGCGPQASCVAGRCLGQGAIAAIAGMRRELYAPIEVAYVGAGDGPSDAPPATASLGARRGAALFLRFAVPLPPERAIVEAYVLLHRASASAADPQPVVLHAARITEEWASRSVSWDRQPRVDEAGSVLTRVRPEMGPWVRLDVRTIVERWRRHTAGDYGIAVLADTRTARGVSVALGATAAAAPVTAHADAAEPPGAMEAGEDVRGALAVGPQLELYVQ